MLKSINCTAIKKLILLQTTKIRNHAMFRKKKDTANKKDTRKKNPLKVLRILSWFSKTSLMYSWFLLGISPCQNW